MDITLSVCDHCSVSLYGRVLLQHISLMNKFWLVCLSPMGRLPHMGVMRVQIFSRVILVPYKIAICMGTVLSAWWYIVCARTGWLSVSLM